ncbi:MAG: hypothetical protein RL701_2102 [Pseudomonadota bacterium]|jgi:hypothetical protein
MNEERMPQNDPCSARILARRLADELTKEELDQVAGGRRANSSSSWSSSESGEGDDGGGDD